MGLTKDPYLYALWGVVVLVVGALIYLHKVEWPIAAGFLVTLGLPSVLSRKVAP